LISRAIAIPAEHDAAVYADLSGSTTTWIAPDPDLVSLSTGGAIGDPVLSHHVKAIQLRSGFPLRTWRR